jgi:hypothetical protein
MRMGVRVASQFLAFLRFFEFNGHIRKLCDAFYAIYVTEKIQHQHQVIIVTQWFQALRMGRVKE